MWSADRGWVDFAFRLLATAGFIFLMLPLIMMFPLSVEPGTLLRFPPSGFSLHWYAAYFEGREWMASTTLSFVVACGASGIATVAGTLAAVGTVRASAAARSIFSLVLLSPILLPTVVVAIAIYGVYASLRLVGSPIGLILAHAVLTIPFVVLNVTAAAASVPKSIEDAAGSLGASPVAVLLQVTIPLLWRGIAAGAVFAFLVSFDEVVIAMFLSGTQAVTLPKRMLDGIFYEMSPILAAISVLLVLLNVMFAVLGLIFARSARAQIKHPL